jgi:tetratricopeptide (TPR) repeat protein
MRSFVLTCVLAVLVATPARAATPEELASLDALHKRRAEAAAVKELDAALQKALQATPEDYELLWRRARLLQWQADSATAKAKMVLGKQTWEVGDHARKVAPERVEGHYYAAVGVGAYAQGLGVLKALGEGIEGKFNERLDQALKLDAQFERGAPLIAKGRYYYELPWPKRDLKKSAALYEKVLAAHPENLRAWTYLAETRLADGDEKQADEAVKKALAGSADYDPPEAQRVLAEAHKVKARVDEELK